MRQQAEENRRRAAASPGMKKGGMVKKMAKGGMVRGDGCAMRVRPRGRLSDGNDEDSQTEALRFWWPVDTSNFPRVVNMPSTGMWPVAILNTSTFRRAQPLQRKMLPRRYQY